MKIIPNNFTELKSRESRAEYLAVKLLHNGVDTAIGIPGTGPVLNFVSIFKEKGGKVLLSKNEASAAIMAGTIGKRKQKPVIAFSANGNGRINLLSGILHCWFERLPVICVWDDYPLGHPKIQRLQKLPSHNISKIFNYMSDGLPKEIDRFCDKLINKSIYPDFGPVGVPLRNTNINS